MTLNKAHTCNSNGAFNVNIFRLSKISIAVAVMGMGISTFSSAQSTDSYTIVDTHQTQCSNSINVMASCSAQDTQGFGQDAQYQGNAPSYTSNDDGTVTDNNTGLTWTQTTDINGDGKITADDKLSYAQGLKYAANLTQGGFDDWRVPTIKELYSLMLFDGEDPSGINGAGTYSIRPFIDHSVFGFESGDTDAGERLIDSQYLSSTKYVSTTMKGDETIFGVNFIDGRIKGYGATSPRGGDKTFYVMVVRGNTDYGVNQFVDNRNDTITDKATGLTWQQADSEVGMDWNSALNYCETLEVDGFKDWRLPNVKELHSIVDYTRSPDTSSSAAIDPLFKVTTIINEDEKIDYPNYWSSTTHLNLKNGKNAAYIAFGRSLGYMNGHWMDVHGAGAQRSDPKAYTGKDYPQGHGPQGDAIRYENYARCVTGGEATLIPTPGVENRATKHYQITENETSMEMNPQRNQSPNIKAFGDSDLPTQRGGKGKGPISELDTNGDGKLSKSEVKGPLKQDFSRLDRNNDGFLTEDEIPSPKGKR